MIKRLLANHLDLESIKNALMLAVIFCALFHLPVMYYKFGHAANGSASLLKKLSIDLGLIYCCTLLFFLGLALHPTLYRYGTFIIFFCSAIASYSLLFLDKPPTYQQTAYFLGDYAWHVDSYLEPTLYIWLGFTMLVCYFASSQYRIKQTQLFLMKMLSASCLFVVIYNIISPSRYFLLKSFFPLLYSHHFYKYFMG